MRMSYNIIANYVWINKQPCAEPTEDDALCGVPLHYFDKAYENAKKHPDVTFNLWVDFNFLDLSSRFFIESHAYLFAPNNLNLRSLHEIDDYKNDPRFAVNTKENIWARVDLARLLVLSHCFKTTASKQVFYTDFDLDDIQVLDEAVQNSLSIHNMVFGKTKSHHIENGYMGFQIGKGADFLNSILIPRTKEESRGEKNGYGALYYGLKDHCYQAFYRAGVVELYDRGFTIEPNLLYKQNLINA